MLRLQAAADGAAGVVVVESAACAALHVVHQAPLLGLQLLIAHRQLPRCLFCSLLQQRLLLPLCVALTHVQLRHIRGGSANKYHACLDECHADGDPAAVDDQDEVIDQQTPYQRVLVREAHAVRAVHQSCRYEEDGGKVFLFSWNAYVSRRHRVANRVNAGAQ